ncbi:di-heme oxidoredictase family protein [Methylopila henanensis]|uniref:Di-heme oxidoredictase family protein n=1 Tax=Methylopila henanensis TaxID=873516 RepID=A0ABW4K4L7_9HYPH
MRLAIALAAIMLAPDAGSAADRLDVAVGKAVFERLWVQAPASTTNADGLGPLFAARSCASCHSVGAGRARFRLGRDDPAAHPGLVIRFGTADGAPDPVYGAELQPKGVGDVAGEGVAAVSFAPGAGALAKPEWRVDGLGYGALGEGVAMSARVAPSLAGLGLLEHVPVDAVLALAAEQAAGEDGVSGRPHWVGTADGRRLGRFGWKAAEPTLAAQAAAAFALDLGLSTPARPSPGGDCTAAQTTCRAAPAGAPEGGHEVADPLLASLVAFLESRPQPPAPASGPRGAAAFAKAGCGACHAPSLPLDGGGAVSAYTDLLLHDMGPGLDDGVGEGAARSAEWRTAPLWGLSRALDAGAGLLHDARARNVDEAVRWHGGEAAAARARYDALPERERAALIAFVNGL